MKKIGCLPAALLAGVLLWASIYVRDSLWPSAEAIVQLPMGDAVARFQTWRGFFESPPFVLRVDTPHGTLSKQLWANWGPAETINLYRTSENWLVGIGGAGEVVVIDVRSVSGSRLVTNSEINQTEDEHWTFLGHARGNEWFSASDYLECVELFGTGSFPYRKQYQAAHTCSLTRR